MPTLHNRFSRVQQSSVGVASHSVIVHVALYNAAHFFNFLNKAVPGFDPIVKSEHESFMKKKQHKTDLGCELKDSTIQNAPNTSFMNQTGLNDNTLDPAYISQIVSEDDSSDYSNNTSEIPPVELEMDCSAFSFHETCMPHIGSSLSIFLIIDILLLFGLHQLPKCSLVETLYATLQYLKHVSEEWQHYILFRNEEHKHVVNDDIDVPSLGNDYVEYETEGDLPESPTLSSISSHKSFSPMNSPRRPDITKFNFFPGRQGRAATQDSKKIYSFDNNRSPSPVLPTFNENSLSIHNILNRSRRMSPKSGRAGNSSLHTVGVQNRRSSYSPTRDKKTFNHLTPGSRPTTSYASKNNASHRSSGTSRSDNRSSSPTRSRSNYSPRHSTSERAAH